MRLYYDESKNQPFGILQVMVDIAGDCITTSESKNEHIGLPFDKFDHKIEDFISWFERFECFLDCNTIDEAKNNKYLIANLNSESYATLKKLCIPKKPVHDVVRESSTVNRIRNPVRRSSRERKPPDFYTP